MQRGYLGVRTQLVALPATLKQKPVSENTIGATLGEDTIKSGTRAIGLAFALRGADVTLTQKWGSADAQAIKQAFDPAGLLNPGKLI